MFLLGYDWLIPVFLVCILILIVIRVRESHKKWEAQQMELRQARKVQRGEQPK
jgi:hypothetical protein